jgi:hypothetical protein
VKIVNYGRKKFNKIITWVHHDLVAFSLPGSLLWPCGVRGWLGRENDLALILFHFFFFVINSPSK